MSSLLQKIWNLLQKEHFAQAQAYLSVFIGLLSIGITIFQAYQKEELKEQNLQYEKQLEVLDEVQSSIDNLKQFVTKQKSQLKEQQAVVEKLKSESEMLKPVVEADKKVVEALFLLQSEQNKTTVWIDRLIGFLLGIFGSLIASIIFSAIRLGQNNKKI